MQSGMRPMIDDNMLLHHTASTQLTSLHLGLQYTYTSLTLHVVGYMSYTLVNRKLCNVVGFYQNETLNIFKA